MILFPAIDLYKGSVVRLLKGDYQKMTVYSDDPLKQAFLIKEKGAEWLHLVDLLGAKEGSCPEMENVKRIIRETGLKAEIGGGIRSLEMIDRYLDAGADRVILGTKAVTDQDFLKESVRLFGDRIAAGVDMKDGYVCVNGWLQSTYITGEDFLKAIGEIGVKYSIVTDISRDGAMQGTNLPLYEKLSKMNINITASGGVSSLDDIGSLKKTGLYGAILGKAMYTGAVRLEDALEILKES